MRFRQALVSVTLNHLPTHEVISLALEAGLEGIEWSGRNHLPVGDLKSAAFIQQQMKKAGLAVLAYGSYLRFNEPAFEQNQLWQRTIETALALGAPAIRVWAGQQGSASVSFEERVALVNRAQAFADLAQHQGLAVYFEFHRKTLTDTPESALNFLHEIDRSSVKSLWQPHVNLPLEEQLRSLELMLPQLAYLHCFFWGLKGSKERYPLQEGGALWQPLLEAALLYGHKDLDLWVAIEFVKDDKIEQLREDAAYLQQLLHTLNSN
ncbi:Sugar phosphate isomerase/epimerase [Marinospirillum celere]|uniref:Sugar phosphate isomerase/epimerase n=1 Tax=Marinospirillum celere TaxID=1122252 RepID=A0A1I1E964_9GAMM|nr:sugar phosphate isomerase/epimerase [Marinospirillum celere]SFB83675.1 Sugar phosphate isomerase/epimerase [Marinospirillum celere]